MAHRFDPKQKIDAQGNLRRATGLVDPPIEKMFWIAAFVYQNEPGHYAAASGTAKWKDGESPKWECKTEMAPGSKPFKKGKARAWALARVTDEGGKFFGWGHEIDLE